jgi:hypothetical protein
VKDKYQNRFFFETNQAGELPTILKRRRTTAIVFLGFVAFSRCCSSVVMPGLGSSSSF